LRTGVADLPLHYGKTPRWLFKRMVELSKGVVDALVYEYGEEELLRRLANPFWFQAFGCLIGFDWHSSGLTTTTCGALKLAISPEKHGIVVAGGKGKISRKAPEEIEKKGELLSLSNNKIEILKYSSRMSAKVDECCVQDFYSLYSHSFIFTEKGEWCTVQQGMKGNYARRYHWLSDNLKSFVEEPHSGICADKFEGRVLNLTAKESEETRKISLDLVRDNPLKLRKYASGQTLLTDFRELNLSLPERHEIMRIDISERGWEFLKKAYELQPQSYEELVSLKGIGAKTLRALALLSDLLYGAEPSWKDPARYSFAHGGKDGIPFPVDKQVYDSTIEILRDAVESAKIGEMEKYHALKRLADFVGT
jgi:hypothetical protein